jgi:cytochrome c oxidase subunit IV
MTKFIDNSKIRLEKKKKTKFTHYITFKDIISTASLGVEYFDVVEYLGWSGVFHLFRAKCSEKEHWNFYIGELGDEFV